MIRIANLEQLMQHAGSNSSNFVILVDNDNKGSVLQINMTVVIYDFRKTPFLINKLLTLLSKGVIVYLKNYSCWNDPGFSVIKYTYSAYFFIVHYITSTHECHFIVFISMDIIFHFDSFRVLLLAVLNSMLHYLFLYPCKFLLLFFLLLWPESNAYLYSYFFTVILLYEFKSLNFWRPRGVWTPTPHF